MEIEDKFDIDIPINLVSDIERIGDLAKLVCQRMEGR
jgi:acyl carrier protein